MSRIDPKRARAPSANRAPKADAAAAVAEKPRPTSRKPAAPSPRAKPGAVSLTGEALPRGRPLPEPHVQELRALALSLKADGVPAVEALGKLAHAAATRYADSPGLNPQEKMDAAMRDLAGAILGNHARTLLEEVKRVATLGGRAALPESSLLERFRVGLGASGIEAMPHGGHSDNLDPTAGLDFKEGFRDGSHNQLFHTFAFVWLQYAGDNELVTRGANLKHELLDPGGSASDFKASHAGMLLGGWLRDLRDGGGDVRDLPALLTGALGKNGAEAGSAKKPWNGGVDRSATATRAHERFQSFLDDPGPLVSLLAFAAENFSRDKVVAEIRELGGTVEKAKAAVKGFFEKLSFR